MLKKNRKIYVTEPSLPPLDECIPYFEKIWKTKWVTNNGHYLKEFECQLGKYLKENHLSVVNNATSGLMIAQKCLNFSGEIITSPFSFIATASSIDWIGLKPVFVDTDKIYGNIDPKKVEEAITPETGGILATHNFGFPAPIEELEQISLKYKIPLIFDAAPAIGVRYKDKSITSYGDSCVLSFHATKIFTTIEGGAVITRTAAKKDQVDKLRNFSIENEDEVSGPGINAKLNEIQAVIGLLQLVNLDCEITRRELRYNQYSNLLSRNSKFSIPPIKQNTHYNYAYFPIYAQGGKTFRDQVIEKLRKENIHCRKYWYPTLNEHKYYGIIDVTYPNAKKLSEGIIALPMGNSIREEDVEHISETINNF